ncbi:MAG: hypothetical protein PHU06_06180 [Gallionella sp.]|nr:hypothetical protein [Gallionella sp.]
MATASSFTLSDYIGISNGTTDAKVSFPNFLAGASTSVLTLPAGAAPAATDTLLSIKGTALVLQSFSALVTYVQSQQINYEAPVLEITANIVLDASSHNGRILAATQPLQVQPAASFSSIGSGFACTLINLSSSAISFASGITVLGGTALAAGASCKIYGLTTSLGSIIYAVLGGASVAAPLTVAAASTAIEGSAIAVSGSVSPSGTAVSVALGTSATTAPTSGFVAATVSGGGFTASLTAPSSAGTVYVWAEFTGTPATQAVSGPIAVSAAPSETLTVNTITAPAASTVFTVSGTYANGTPTALDYSTNGGSTWTAATSPTIGSGTYSFSIASGLAAGTYTIEVRDHNSTSVTATSNSFTIAAATSYPTLSLVSGSGNGSLVGQTFSFPTGGAAPTNVSTSIVRGSSVAPNLMISGTAPGPAVAYFDTNNTATLPSSGGNTDAGTPGGMIWAFNAAPAPSTPGTYYLKYAIYQTSTSGTLLGVVVSSAITVT